MENIFVEFLPPWVETGIQPAFYDKESGSVLQQTARMYARVNMLIRMFNKLSKETKETVEEYITKFDELHDYVHDYFDNLDVQEEINNKLDDMVEQGTLQEIITDYIQANVAWTFDTVADLKAATNLVAGSYAQTLGYYAIGDGGASTYYITDTGTANEMDVIAVGSLYANLLINDQTINIKQFGAKGDGTTDETTLLNYVFGLAASKVKKIYLNEKYLISSTLSIESNKDIIGVKSNIQGTDYSPEILSNTDIKFIDCTNKTNINIKNLNIKHINTQTQDVIDLTRARYINLDNVKIYQPDTSTNCTAIAINDTNSSSNFSGYFEFNNVTASYHKVGIKSRATYITLNNCNINHCTDYAIWLTDEGIGGINSCNITGEGVAIRYDGNYMLNINSCYMEGYYINECIQNTHNVPVNMKGCKIYNRTGTGTSIVVVSDIVDLPQNYRNTPNSFIDGYANATNLTLNGNLSEEKFWGVRGTTEYIAKGDMDVNIGLPPYAEGCYKLGSASGNSAIYQLINESFNVGETVTVSAWIYTEDGEDVTRPLLILAPSSDEGYTTQAGSAVVYSRPTKNGIWQLYSVRCKIETAVNNLAVKVQTSGVGNVSYVTGVTVMRGVASTLKPDYTPNRRKAIFDNLIIKGSDNKYYQLSYDGTNLSFTETTKPQVI